jgi:hypothetical protein
MSTIGSKFDQSSVLHSGSVNSLQVAATDYQNIAAQPATTPPTLSFEPSREKIEVYGVGGLAKPLSVPKGLVNLFNAIDASPLTQGTFDLNNNGTFDQNVDVMFQKTGGAVNIYYPQGEGNTSVARDEGSNVYQSYIGGAYLTSLTDQVSYRRPLGLDDESRLNGYFGKKIDNIANAPLINTK